MALLPFDYAARNAARKPLTTVLTTLGASAVIFLVILMGAFVETLSTMMRSTGEAHNVIVLGTGSEDFLEQSEIAFNVPTVLAASVSGIARHYGTPLISPEIHHAAVVRSTKEAKDSDKVRFGLVRGVTPAAFLLHRQVFTKEGRTPQTGEVMLGKLAHVKLGLPPEAARVGGEVYFEGRPWRISGVFEAPGTAFEAELWVPLEDLKVVTKRKTLTCAVVRVNSPAQYVDVSIFCKSRLDLEISAVREVAYYGTLARFFRPMQALGWIMAGLITAAGLFGGLNTMVAAITARSRELACLETIGFSRRAIAVSLLQESLLQVGTGALIAAALALTFLAGTTVRFVMGALSMEVAPHVLLAGFGAGLFLAVVGTIIPAVRLFRTPLVELLRS